MMYYGIPGRRHQLGTFYRQFIAPGALAFDVGAHVGNRLQAWLDIGAKAVAVEPQPACMALLQQWYGHQESVTLLDMALGAKPSKHPIFISRRTPTVTTLSPEWQEAVQQVDSFASVRWDQQGTVNVTTLDDLIQRFGVPTFCKIDVEGYEYEVLKGLSQPIRTISFEYIPAALSISVNCINRINELGRYQFNWSPGERHQLQAAQWMTSAEMIDELCRMDRNDDSGDVYAREISAQ
ncbi:MAG: FkbM family methyltransferase [Chloroflexota bacterium]